MLKSLLDKLKEAAISVIPVTLIVLLLNFTPFVSFTLTETVVFSCCALALIVGMALFNLGAEHYIAPHLRQALSAAIFF